MKRKANPGFDPNPGFEKSFPGSGSGSRINRDPGINPGIPQGPGVGVWGVWGVWGVLEAVAL